MDKIVLTLLTGMLMVGCVSKDSELSDECENVRTMMHDGHRYLVWWEGDGRCVVHDPDCECEW